MGSDIPFVSLSLDPMVPHPLIPSALAQSWLDASRRDDVALALESVYADAAGAIAARGPSCWASGRCCNFKAAGHLLYVTGLEAAYTLVRLPPPAVVPPQPEPVKLALPLQQARDRGGCPFQSANLCGVHAIKPLGCRVYFCDRSAQEWQNLLSERLLADVRAIHDRFGIEYRYGEWLNMLGQFDPPSPLSDDAP